MIVFPNCKINLGLHILDKRPDGFHNLETVFFPVPLQDALEIVPADKPYTTCTTTGISIDISPEHNICTKAFGLLKKDFPHLPEVQIHLHKTIPTGAGLGGGSANGAFTLLLVNKKWSLGLQQEQLLHYAAQLGSDCPFFILNKPCFAAGRGELLHEISVDLSAYRILMVYPPVHINTGWAFGQLKPGSKRTPVNEIIQQPVTEWKQVLVNDFEAPIFQQFPAIKNIKEKLYEAGAVYASLSGSGSTVYGLFDKDKEPTIDFPENYFIKLL